MYGRLVTAVRLLMGADFVMNGLNWWVKLIGPYPSIADYAHKAPPPDFVGAMIQTHILFHIVKATELLTGIAMLTNSFVPLMLVAIFPVTVPVFIVDVIMIHHVRGFIMGMGAMLMNTFLMLAHLSYYQPMLTARASPDPLPGLARGGAHLGPTFWQASPLRRVVMPLYGAIAAAFGVVMVTWVAVMIVQHFAG